MSKLGTLGYRHCLLIDFLPTWWKISEKLWRLKKSSGGSKAVPSCVARIVRRDHVQPTNGTDSSGEVPIALSLQLILTQFVIVRALVVVRAAARGRVLRGQVVVRRQGRAAQVRSHGSVRIRERIPFRDLLHSYIILHRVFYITEYCESLFSYLSVCAILVVLELVEAWTRIGTSWIFSNRFPKYLEGKETRIRGQKRMKFLHLPQTILWLEFSPPDH